MKTTYTIFLAFTIFTLYGQTPEEQNIDNYYVDFAVPDLAAFTLLGLENDQIARPGNLKELGVSLSSLVGTEGKLNPSLGIEYAPFVSLTKSSQKKYWTRGFRWNNLSVSLASQVDDSLGNRLSFGFKWVPIDLSEPIGDDSFYKQVSDFLRTRELRSDANYFADVSGRIINVLNADNITDALLQQEVLGIFNIANTRYRDGLVKKQSSGDIGSLTTYLVNQVTQVSFYDSLSERSLIELSEISQEVSSFLLNRDTFEDGFNEKLKEAKENYKEKNWNALVLQLSTGWVWNSENATYEDLDKEKLVAFLGIATPMAKSGWFHEHSQTILHIQYSNDESMLTEYDNRFSTGLRFLFGNANNRLSIEGMYSRTKLDLEDDNGDEERETFLRWAVGGEMKLSQGSWVEIAIGGQELFNGENRILPTFGLRHALQNKRRFNTN